MKGRLLQFCLILPGLLFLVKFYYIFPDVKIYMPVLKMKAQVVLDESIIRQIVQKENYDEIWKAKKHVSNLTCDIPYLNYMVANEEEQEGSHVKQAACKRTRPISDSCEIAKKAFLGEKPVACDKRQQMHICTVMVSVTLNL